MFSDLPIQSRGEDLLGRARLASDVSRTILGWQSEESFVVGLYGEWGSGKSSLINLLEEAILECVQAEGRDLTVVRFNPWNFSDQNQLIAMFFSELFLQMRKAEPGADIESLGKLLLGYATLVAPVAAVHPLAIAVAGTMAAAGKILKSVGKAQREDFPSLRKRIDSHLRERNRKILIFLDDIDRLNKTEIRQLFQLVKLTADFPNTVYVLALDPDHVREQLREEFGAEYLEKIIQIPIDIPMVMPESLRDLLLERLDEFFQRHGVEFDKYRFLDVYSDGLDVLFRSIRDINRFMNALEALFPTVKSEVNSSDFAAVQALNVFEPTVHARLWSYRSVLVSRANPAEKRREGLAEQYERVIEPARKERREQIRNVVRRLFPHYDGFLSGSTYEYSFDAPWERERRVCSERHFPNYFILGVPGWRISEAELQRLLDLAASTGELLKFLEEILVRVNLET